MALTGASRSQLERVFASLSNQTLELLSRNPVNAAAIAGEVLHDRLSRAEREKAAGRERSYRIKQR